MRFMRHAWRHVLQCAVMVLAAAALGACGSSSVPNVSSAGGGSSDLGACTTDVSTDQTVVSDLLPSVAQVQARQAAVDQFGGGFRIGANAAEIGYIHYLAAQLRAQATRKMQERAGAVSHDLREKMVSRLPGGLSDRFAHHTIDLDSQHAYADNGMSSGT